MVSACCCCTVGCDRPWDGWTGVNNMEMIFPEVSRVTRGRYEGQATDVARELFNQRPRTTVG